MRNYSEPESPAPWTQPLLNHARQ